jgi:AraC-like DNA-binding protein
MVLDAADLRRPMPRADGGLLGILIEYANDALSNTGDRDPFLDQVKRVVMASLRSGEVSIEHIAQQLGTSARTIQRWLQDSGYSFKDLVAQTRISLSRRYLEDASMSLTDAAYLLGYSDLSAFSRAFRRWTGQSAREFRRQHTMTQPPTTKSNDA